jgi:RNA polymerase sigma factor (sigma-70 family)
VEETELVNLSKAGDVRAFSGLTARYRRRAYGYFMARIGDADEAEDLCQEAFLKAFVYLRGLRESGRFGPWLFAICRNCLRKRFSALASKGARELPLAEDLPDRENAEWESYQDLARASLGLLDRELRSLVELRYGSGLSYGQISAASGLSLPLVKSRLFRARSRLRAIRADIEAGVLMGGRRDTRLKEAIMKDVKTVKRCAWCLERLSLRDQLDLARAAAKNEAFGERLLSEIAAMEGGKEFLKDIGAKLDFPEFIECLNYSDPFIERRLVDTFEALDPEFAERIKRSMFVFEDFVLFDPSAIAALAKRADRKILALALSSSDRRVKAHFLSSMPAKEAETLRGDMEAAVGDNKAIEESRFMMVETARAMDKSGEIAVMRMNEIPEGQVYVTAKKG